MGRYSRVGLVCVGLCTACGARSLATNGESSSDDTSPTPTATPPNVPDPLTRALRFDYESECVARQAIDLWQDPSVQLVQDGVPILSWMKCSATRDEAACWQSVVPCEEMESELDSSQWPEQSTVYEILGVDAARVNPRATNLGVGPIYNSGYYDGHYAFLPPGCNPNIDCSHWWYLDVTEAGIALVACPAMVANLPDYLPNVTLDLCLVE